MQGLFGLIFVVIAAVIIIRVARKSARKKEQSRAKEKPDLTASSSYSASVNGTAQTPEQQALEKARTYVIQEKLINARINNEAVKSSAAKVLAQAEKCLNVLKEKPEKVAKSSQFLTYYVPTLGLILQKYKKLEISGMDIHETTDKVVAYMHDIETAMGREYQNLFKNDLLDLSVEMKAMTIACQRDGLLTDEDLQHAYEAQTVDLTV